MIPAQFSLEGKTVIVPGCNRSLGRAMALGRRKRERISPEKTVPPQGDIDDEVGT